MNKKKYYSGVGWLMICLVIFAIVVAIVAAIGAGWTAMMPMIGIIVLFMVLIFGTWYEVDNNSLTVYQYFRPHKYPISKIREVKKTKGYLTTAGLSNKRVSIKFTDRSVMKSSWPLEVSPRDRDGFIAHLKQINPEIELR